MEIPIDYKKGLDVDPRVMKINFDKINCEDLETNDNCNICLTKIELESCIKLKCCHMYHELCIRHWFRTNFSCPTCRKIPCIILPKLSSGVHTQSERSLMEARRHMQIMQYMSFNDIASHKIDYGICRSQIFYKEEIQSAFPEPVSSYLQNSFRFGNKTSSTSTQSSTKSGDDSKEPKSHSFNSETKREEFVVLSKQSFIGAIANPGLPKLIMSKLKWLARPDVSFLKTFSDSSQESHTPEEFQASEESQSSNSSGNDNFDPPTRPTETDKSDKELIAYHEFDFISVLSDFRSPKSLGVSLEEDRAFQFSFYRVYSS